MIEDDELWREFEALFGEYPEEARAILTTEVVQRVMRAEKRRLRKNARAREKRQWLKTANREDTALRWRGKPVPCTIAQYLMVERAMLNWLAEHPDEKPDAEWVLLTLAHAVLHMLRPEARYEDFTTHDLCSTAIDLGFNFTLHPSLKVKPGDINWTLIRLTSGLDKELLKFNTLLGDIHIDV